MNKEEAINILMNTIYKAYPLKSSKCNIEERNKAIEALYFILKEE